jgi:hypothetical protein
MPYSAAQLKYKAFHCFKPFLNMKCTRWMPTRINFAIAFIYRHFNKSLFMCIYNLNYVRLLQMRNWEHTAVFVLNFLVKDLIMYMKSGHFIPVILRQPANKKVDIIWKRWETPIQEESSTCKTKEKKNTLYAFPHLQQKKIPPTFFIYLYLFILLIHILFSASSAEII